MGEDITGYQKNFDLMRGNERKLSEVNEHNNKNITLLFSINQFIMHGKKKHSIISLTQIASFCLLTIV